MKVRLPESAPAVLPINNVLPLLGCLSAFPLLMMTFCNMPMSTCVPVPPLGSTRILLLPALVMMPRPAGLPGKATDKFWVVMPVSLALMSSVPPPCTTLFAPAEPRVSKLTPLSISAVGAPASEKSSLSVPWLIVRPPVKGLCLVRVRVPGPVTTSAPAPVMTPP